MVAGLSTALQKGTTGLVNQVGGAMSNGISLRIVVERIEQLRPFFYTGREVTSHLGTPASNRDALSWLEEQITVLLNQLQGHDVSADDHIGLVLNSTDSTLNPPYQPGFKLDNLVVIFPMCHVTSCRVGAAEVKVVQIGNIAASRKDRRSCAAAAQIIQPHTPVETQQKIESSYLLLPVKLRTDGVSRVTCRHTWSQGLVQGAAAHFVTIRTDCSLDHVIANAIIEVTAMRLLLLLAVLLHCGWMASSIVCPGGGKTCQDDMTCCQLPSGQQGCCPFKNAVCCSDKVHCCPQGVTSSGKFGDAGCSKGRGETVALHVGTCAACSQLPSVLNFLLNRKSYLKHVETGPKISSLKQSIELVMSTRSVGSKNLSPHERAGLPPKRNLAPLAKASSTNALT
uniref:Granulins domain-containing protein n=1 Tax=Timema monikensis TaxID=170555 RepID=A0A7R9ECH2_9NEOP|nr:unnamed protein product [Timema monikensis]